MSRSKLVIISALILLTVANMVTPFRVRQVAIELRPAILVHVGPLAISNTLIASWVGMALLVVLALFCRRDLVDSPRAQSLQNIVEAVFELLLDYMQRFAGANAIRFFPMAATFFLYILTANWLALAPGVGSLGWVSATAGEPMTPLLRGMATDLNATLALAFCSVASAQYYGLRMRGALPHLSRYIAIGAWVSFARQTLQGNKPPAILLLRGLLDLFIGLLEIFEELTKLLSFSFRLFGNIFGGEVLLAVIAFLMPFIAAIPFLALELFTGLIQAFIFAILSTAFFARTVAQHHETATATASSETRTQGDRGEHGH